MLLNSLPNHSVAANGSVNTIGSLSVRSGFNSADLLVLALVVLVAGVSILPGLGAQSLAT